MEKSEAEWKLVPILLYVHNVICIKKEREVVLIYMHLKVRRRFVECLCQFQFYCFDSKLDFNYIVQILKLKIDFSQWNIHKEIRDTRLICRKFSSNFICFESKLDLKFV